MENRPSFRRVSPRRDRILSKLRNRETDFENRRSVALCTGTFLFQLDKQLRKHIRNTNDRNRSGKVPGGTNVRVYKSTRR